MEQIGVKARRNTGHGRFRSGRDSSTRFLLFFTARGSVGGRIRRAPLLRRSASISAAVDDTILATRARHSVAEARPSGFPLEISPLSNARRDISRFVLEKPRSTRTRRVPSRRHNIDPVFRPTAGCHECVMRSFRADAPAAPSMNFLRSPAFSARRRNQGRRRFHGEIRENGSPLR